MFLSGEDSRVGSARARRLVAIGQSRRLVYDRALVALCLAEILAACSPPGTSEEHREEEKEQQHEECFRTQIFVGQESPDATRGIAETRPLHGRASSATGSRITNVAPLPRPERSSSRPP